MSRLRIAHLSDPHFGTILPGVREGILSTLLDLQTDLVLFTGDISQRARKTQFLEALDFAQKCERPLITVPGNHDIALFNVFERFFDPYRGFRRIFKYRLEKDLLKGDVLISGLNSTSRWRHIQGELDTDRLETHLCKKQGNAKIHIVAFHHPMDCAKTTDEKNLLKNRDQVIPILAQHNVDLILGGHIHDPTITLSKKRYPQEPRSMVIGVAGTCLSWRTRPGAPNSFNLIETDTTKDVPRLTITRYDQRDNLRMTPEQVHCFSRHDTDGWALEDVKFERSRLMT